MTDEPATSHDDEPADGAEPADATESAADHANRGTPAASPRLTRRRVVAGGAALGVAALAGCADDDSPPDETTDTPTDTPAETDEENEADDDEGDDAAPDLPQVAEPPAATYLPTHFESMRHLDPVEAGEFEVVPMVTYPHAFWNVTGDEVEVAEPTGGEDVHLMITVRDPETGTILPAEAGTELEVGPEGGSKSPHAPWPMISQEMGFHIGDNVPLGDDGTYEVDVRVGAIDARKTGEFAGRFDEAGRATFTFEFDDDFRREVVGGIHYLDEEHWGEHGALANHVAGHGGHDGENGDHDDENGDHDDEDDHHDGHDEDDHHDGHDDHDHHGNDRWSEGEGHHRFGTYRRGADAGELPPAAELPGELLGEPDLGDALLATTLLDRGSRFVDDDAYYLAVSPRTPYNRSMLPMMALSYDLRRDGETVSEGPLRDTLDHELGYHYAAPLADAEAGDELIVSVDTVPNVSRHAGYETAFLEDDAVDLEVELP